MNSETRNEKMFTEDEILAEKRLSNMEGQISVILIMTALNFFGIAGLVISALQLMGI